MIEYLPVISQWSAQRQPILLARVIQTWGSAPRPAGSIMLVNGNGEVAGSVSGGCVEGTVVRQGLENLPEGNASMHTFGVSNDEAWSVGLSCGGNIQVFTQPLVPSEPVWDKLLTAVRENSPAILVSSLEDGHNSNALLLPDGTAVGDSIDESLATIAWAAYKERQHRSVEHKGTNYFIHLFPRKPQLIIIGVAHITTDLVTLGNMFGFETIVIDPRGYFTEKTVFTTQPDRLLNDYPSEVLPGLPLDAYSFCAILSHDPKIDDDALEVLLSSDAGYIGALGSRKTHARRIARLLEKGISNEKISRIHAPVGLPIGARSAREIALSVMSEIIQVKNQFA